MRIVPAICAPMDLDAAIGWSDCNHVVEEKMDGVRAVVWVDADGVRVTGRRKDDAGNILPLTHHNGLPGLIWDKRIAGTVLDGESMADGSFFAFDCLALRGRDIRRLPFRERRAALESLADWLPEEARIIRQCRTVSELGDFDEGVVWKDLRERYGYGFYKARRQETFDVMVHRVLGGGVVEVLGRGRICACPDDLKVGDLIEVIAFKEWVRTGKLRNGRYLRKRDDKDAPHDNPLPASCAMSTMIGAPGWSR